MLTLENLSILNQASGFGQMLLYEEDAYVSFHYTRPGLA